MKVKGFSDNKEDPVSGCEADQTKLQVLLPVYQWGSKLLQARNEEIICNLVGDALQEQIDPVSLSVMLFDESSSCLRIVASRGLSRRVVDHSRIKPGERISGRVFATQTPLLIDRADQSPEEIQSLLSRDELSSSISFPLVSRKESIGVINIGHCNGQRRYRSSDIELVSILAQLAVTAIENVRLTRQKQENNRIRTLFEQYVSPEVARMLLDQGSPAMEMGTSKALTVMFADIRNYTFLVQNLSLPDLREFLDEFFKMFTRVVYRNRGTLDKFMGDGAMVIFGAPAVLENPNKAAVITAMEVARDFQELRAMYGSKCSAFSRIGLGIGISHGEVFLGNLGSGERFDYTVVGPDVNIAQRLASTGDPDRVLCTDAVIKSWPGQMQTRAAETIKLKGFQSPIKVYEIGFD